MQPISYEISFDSLEWVKTIGKTRLYPEDYLAKGKNPEISFH